MLVSDLDGTLLLKERGFASQDLIALKKMGEAGVIRVIATGRSIFSLQRVLAKDFPVDYVIFSSGVGIIDWKKRELISRSGMSRKNVLDLQKTLENQRLNYMIHRPAPHNHWFSYRMQVEEKTDFRQRVIRYRQFADLIVPGKSWRGGNASQLLAVAPPQERRLNRLRVILGPQCHFVRTTSPLDGISLWMELMPTGISKAAGIRLLAKKLAINLIDTVAVGNDFNDIDMLRAVGNPLVTPDAPKEMIEEFPVIRTDAPGILSSLETQFPATGPVYVSQ